VVENLTVGLDRAGIETESPENKDRIETGKRHKIDATEAKYILNRIIKEAALRQN
jgi:hypothetical protein